LLLDSGLSAPTGDDGVKVNLGSPRLSFLSNKKLTIPDAVAGTGLIWDGNALAMLLGIPFRFNGDSLSLLLSNRLGLNYIDPDNTQLTIPNSYVGFGIGMKGDSANVLLSRFTIFGNNIDNILVEDGDSIQFNYNPDHLQSEPPGLSINLDSGMTSGSDGIAVWTDYAELGFNVNGQLETKSTLWGNGLYKSGDSGNVRVSEFAKVENDTVKPKTSDVAIWYGENLATGMSNGESCLPYDTTGLPMFAAGKIKRVAVTYQKSNAIDIVEVTNLNISFAATDKIRVTWDNSKEVFCIYKWTMGSHAWTKQTEIGTDTYADTHWRVSVEYYQEAQ
jgi:hypothetical protein